MSAIDPTAAHSARRIADPRARAAIVAKVQADASYYAGILSGLTEVAYVLANGTVHTAEQQVAA